jgi:plasmid stabilization system protein ParE
MTARYDLTAQAMQDLAEIADSIVESSGLAPAEQVVREFQRCFQFLAEQPGAGHGREDVTDDPQVRFWSVYSY